jgi:hypothetical protein
MEFWNERYFDVGGVEAGIFGGHSPKHVREQLAISAAKAGPAKLSGPQQKCCGRL